MNKIVFVMGLLCFAFIFAYAEGEHNGLAYLELRQWKGVPVKLILYDADCTSIEDFPVYNSDFSIKKNEPSEQEDYGSVEINASSEAGLLYGVFFILRSQNMGDGCLCQTVRSDEPLYFQPRFKNRVGEWEYTDILTAFNTDSLRQLARASAMVGINGVLIRKPANVSRVKFRRMMRQVREVLSLYYINVYDSEEKLGEIVRLTYQGSDDSIPFMAKEWERQLAEYDAKNVRSIVLKMKPSDNMEEHPFISANQYAFGRITFENNISADRIAYEWLSTTYTENPLFIRPMRDLMLNATEGDFCTMRKTFETYFNN